MFEGPVPTKPPVKTTTKTKTSIVALVGIMVLVGAMLLGLFTANVATTVFKMAAGKGGSKSVSEPTNAALEAYLSQYAIDFSNKEIKSLPFNVKNKLRKLSSDRQVELNNQLEGIKEKIEKKGNLWKANFNSKFILSKEEQKKLLGLIITEEEIERSQQILENRKIIPPSAKAASDLPDFFDWRDQHGNDYITPIRDQSSCGSCWAFGAVAALEGHANAYYNNPNLDVDLSEQDLVSCYHGSGCSGAYTGQIETIFSNYYQTTGIATEDCFPYTATNDNCNNKCGNWQDDAWKTVSFQRPELTIEAIKETLIEYGPIEVGMAVYEDFFSYDGGIYIHITGRLAGHHAVTIVGFGKHDGLDYWIVKNSWGANWGEEGYFRIVAGDSDIDSQFAYAVDQPIAPYPEQKLCNDNDGDGYCNWGLGTKPADGCPVCDDIIKDCDDSNLEIFEGCGMPTIITGFLSITSEPSDTGVYVEIDGNYIYRGNTPLEIELNSGVRDVKISKIGYLDYTRTVNIQEGQITILNAILNRDTSYQEGWPVEIGFLNFGSSPAVADLDQDGENEIIAAAGDYVNPGDSGENKIYVFDKSGNLKSGWPIYIGANWKSHYGRVPAIADLDGDGNLELISSIYEGNREVGIYVWKYDGTLLDGWPIKIKELNDIFITTTIVEDINSNGEFEIILPLDKRVYIFDKQGNSFPGWPQETGCVAFEHAAVGDLDSDGKKEIVFGCDYPHNYSTLYVWNSDGVLLDGWPKILPQGVSNSILGDIDDDGEKEIIIRYMVSSYADVNLDVLDKYGNSKPGWPMEHFTSMPSSPSLGDLNNNGKLEIVFTQNTKIYILNHDGTSFGSWPVDVGEEIFSRVVIGDINGDGNLDIIAGDPLFSETSRLYAYNLSGQLLAGWPKIMEGSLHWTSPAISDVDNDGDVEILAGAYQPSGGAYEDQEKFLYIWDLPGSYNYATMEWPMLL
jgi:C1A family cysteine protease